MPQNNPASTEEVRMQMRTNLRYRFELLAAISKVSRDHGITISDESLGNLVLVDASEIEKELHGTGPTRRYQLLSCGLLIRSNTRNC